VFILRSISEQATNITHNAKKLPMLSQGIEIYTTDPYWTELHIQKYKTYYSRTLIIFLCGQYIWTMNWIKLKYRKFKTETCPRMIRCFVLKHTKHCIEDEGTTMLQNAKNYVPTATVLTSYKTSIISSTTVRT
jgi:hypothetical protein